MPRHIPTRSPWPIAQLVYIHTHVHVYTYRCMEVVCTYVSSIYVPMYSRYSGQS